VISPERALTVPEPDLVQELVNQYRVSPPRLNLEQSYTRGAGDARVPVRSFWGPNQLVYVPGTRFEIHVPFDGDPELFRLRPSTYTVKCPRGRVEGHELVIWHEARADSVDLEQFKAQFKAQLDGELHLIQQYLEWVSIDCARFNDELRREIKQAVQQRRKKVLQDRNLEAFLKIPVERRSDASPVFAVPVQARRKLTGAARPRPSVTEPFTSEPAISSEDYAEILTVVRSYRDLVERLPHTFSPMSEEVLRDILLVVLNNQFGPVGGEVFSRRGRTDIFIWHETGAVFIAECKFWKGSKAFGEALDQLLGYLVWRDTKAALILYVREKNVTDIVEQAGNVLKTHQRYKRRDADVATCPVYVLHHDGDPNREIKKGNGE
jgi:hypothetical protein